MSSEEFVLVTGAAGFIGANVVRSYSTRGSRIVSVDNLEHFDSRKEHQGIDFGTRVETLELFNWLEYVKPNIAAIIHMGACANTMETDRSFLWKMNVEYSQRLWTYATEHSIPFVYASSAATYGDGSLGYDDDESLIPKLKPLNAYGDSKQAFDLWAIDQDKIGECPPLWSGWKFFNVYGPGERHKGNMASVVLHAFDQINQRGSVKLFRSHREGIADGHQKRDFIFVEDVLSVLRFALEADIEPGIYNLGSGQSRTFLDLANAVFASLNREPNIEFIDTPIEIREKYQYLTEAQMDRVRELGYDKPFTSLEEGVAKYVAQLNRTTSLSN
jgi:ADP-L-glycero-D-manno-heptose 6-epimerase